MGVTVWMRKPDGATRAEEKFSISKTFLSIQICELSSAVNNTFWPFDPSSHRIWIPGHWLSPLSVLACPEMTRVVNLARRVYVFWKETATSPGAHVRASLGLNRLFELEEQACCAVSYSTSFPLQTFIHFGQTTHPLTVIVLLACSYSALHKTAQSRPQIGITSSLARLLTTHSCI